MQTKENIMIHFHSVVFKEIPAPVEIPAIISMMSGRFPKNKFVLSLSFWFFNSFFMAALTEEMVLLLLLQRVYGGYVTLVEPTYDICSGYRAGSTIYGL